MSRASWLLLARQLALRCPSDWSSTADREGGRHVGREATTSSSGKTRSVPAADLHQGQPMFVNYRRGVTERWISTDAGKHLAARVKTSTAPEVALRRALHAAGYRFRLHPEPRPRLHAGSGASQAPCGRVCRRLLLARVPGARSPHTVGWSQCQSLGAEDGAKPGARPSVDTARARRRLECDADLGARGIAGCRRGGREDRHSIGHREDSPAHCARPGRLSI